MNERPDWGAFLMASVIWVLLWLTGWQALNG